VLEQTTGKMVGFARRAKEAGCRLVVYPEGTLQSAVANRKAEIDAAIDGPRALAAELGVYLVFGLAYRNSDRERLHNQALVVGPDGRIIQRYDKLWDAGSSGARVPGSFPIDGVPCCVAICADRWFRGAEELPAFAGSKILIELSNNFADEWLPDLGWFWYVPRAVRNTAFVVLANTPCFRPVEEAALLGPGHGHNVVITPDGIPLAAASGESDRLIVATLDLTRAALQETKRRHDHPAMKEFWDRGLEIMNGANVGSATLTPFAVPRTDVKIAAAQTICSSSIDRNLETMERMIEAASAGGADAVAFPELAVTGARPEDISRAGEAQLASALERILRAARRGRITVAFGMPHLDGEKRWNCAWVAGPLGEVMTRHAELDPGDDGLFARGVSTRSLWFELKGIPSAVTLGREALWSELAELAAIRGAQIHLHLANDAGPSGFSLRLKRRLFVNLASFRTLTATVNTASPESRGNPHNPDGGRSAIWDDFHRFTRGAVPFGYVGSQRYSAVRVVEAGVEEQLLYASCTIEGVNPHAAFVMDHNPQMGPWYQIGCRAVNRE
jgi:predicted amidohydrolase